MGNNRENVKYDTKVIAAIHNAKRLSIPLHDFEIPQRLYDAGFLTRGADGKAVINDDNEWELVRRNRHPRVR